MKNPKFILRGAVLAFASATPAFGQYGGLDGTFTPTVSGSTSILSLVPAADGGIVVTGDFSQIKDLDAGSYKTLYRVAKFSSGGILDQNFAPNMNGEVYNAAAEPDGTVLLAGLFTAGNITGTPITRMRVARLLDDGDIDSSFVSAWTGLGSVTSVARHTTGYLYAADAGLVRVNLNGTNDSSFTVFGATVNSTTVQTDDRFLINGPFGAFSAAVDSSYLERLSQNGTAASPAFSHNISAQVYCSAIQADGKILVGGIFGGKQDGYVNSGITRLLSTGAVDSDFQTVHEKVNGIPFIDGAVRSIAIQADGKIVIAGDFTNIRTAVTVNGQPVYTIRRGVARLNADGRLDETFDAKIDSAFGGTPRVFGAALQADGKVLINGEFLTFNSNTSSRPKGARLINYAATQALTYDGTTLTWTRGGSAPEARSVYLEYRSATSGSSWQPVDNGIAARVGTSSNWSRTTSTIPAFSYIRASARTSAGQANGSTGIVSQTIGYKIPRVSLRRDTPLAILTNGGSTAFINVGVNRPRDFSFTLTNTGDGAMSGISAQLTGGQAGQFSIQTAPPSTLAIGASATIVVRFSPTSTGSKTTTFRINSNAPDSPQFNVTLNGTAVPEMEGFRYEYFGTTANTGDAADSADPDGDGHTNLFEFVAGLIPNDRNSKFEQRVDRSSGTPKVIFSPIVSGRTYEVQTTTTLDNDWAAAAGGSASTSGVERTYTHTGVTDPKRFYRIKITK